MYILCFFCESFRVGLAWDRLLGLFKQFVVTNLEDHGAESLKLNTNYYGGFNTASIQWFSNQALLFSSKVASIVLRKDF